MLKTTRYEKFCNGVENNKELIQYNKLFGFN